MNKLLVLTLLLLSGCAGFSVKLGQIEQQLPSEITASEMIAVETLGIRYQLLQWLRAVLNGTPMQQLPPLPMPPSMTPAPMPTPIPSPVPTPVPMPPAPIPPPAPVPTVPLR